VLGIVEKIYFPAPEQHPYVGLVYCRLESGMTAVYFSREVKSLAIKMKDSDFRKEKDGI